MKKSILMLLLAIMVFAAGCANEGAADPQVPPEDDGKLTDYMASVEEQAALISASLENDPLTQAEMNAKSQELYELWDDALNYLWAELKTDLPEEEFAKLQDEQITWIEEKEKAAEEAGKEYEGGTIYALIVNSEAAKITEERVYELYDMLKP